MAALFVVTLALAAVAGGRSLRLVAALTAVVVLVGAAGVVAASARDHSARRFTSDRSRRVELTWKVFRTHPVVGVGLGSQPVASQARSKQGGSPTRFVSHTTPLTVAAELGVIGLAAYVALLGGAAVLIEQVRRRAPALGLGLARRCWPCSSIPSAYSGFFEDPVTWVVLAVASFVLAHAGRCDTRRVQPLATREPNRDGLWALLATLGVLVAIRFRSSAPGLAVRPAVGGTRAASSARSSASPTASGISASSARRPCSRASLVALAAAAAWRIRSWPRWAGGRRSRARLRDAARARGTPPGRAPRRDRPWYFTNDSDVPDRDRRRPRPHGTQPVRPRLRELGARALLPGCEDEKLRSTTRRDTTSPIPGHGADAAAWRVLPRPWDDYRIFVLLATLALLPAALLFPGALYVRLAVGAAPGREPDHLTGAWFGLPMRRRCSRSCSPSRLLARGRLVWAAASLGAALALKQFALVAVPFFAVMLLTKHAPRATLYRAGAAFGGVFLATVIPFLIADPGALWRDTVSYGAGTYRIVGYGLAALLLNLGAIDDRFGELPLRAGSRSSSGSR